MATSLLWSAWLSCSSTASREVIEDNRLEKMEVVSPVEEMPVEVLGQLSTNCLVAAEDGGDEEDGVCWPRLGHTLCLHLFLNLAFKQFGHILQGGAKQAGHFLQARRGGDLFCPELATDCLGFITL